MLFSVKRCANINYDFFLQDRREREQQDLEYAKEMADEDDDGFP